MRSRPAGRLADLHRRAVIGFAAVLAGYALALSVIANDTRTHALGLRGLAILVPMLAVSMATGSVSFDDITLAWTLTSLPDADALERDLAPAEPRGASAPASLAPQAAPADPVPLADPVSAAGPAESSADLVGTSPGRRLAQVEHRVRGGAVPLPGR